MNAERSDQDTNEDERSEALARAHLLGSVVDPDGLARLVTRVTEHHEALDDAPDAERADQVFTELIDLLNLAIDEFDHIEDDDLVLVSGAAEYFILDDDFEEDPAEGGLLDDLAVVRAVREAIER